MIGCWHPDTVLTNRVQKARRVESARIGGRRLQQLVLVLSRSDGVRPRGRRSFFGKRARGLPKPATPGIGGSDVRSEQRACMSCSNNGLPATTENDADGVSRSTSWDGKTGPFDATWRFQPLGGAGDQTGAIRSGDAAESARRSSLHAAAVRLVGPFGIPRRRITIGSPPQMSMSILAYETCDSGLQGIHLRPLRRTL